MRQRRSRPITAEQLRSVVRDAITADSGALGEATQSLEALNAIAAIVTAKGDAVEMPDFSLLRGLLKVVDGLTSGIRAEIVALAEGGDVAGDGDAGSEAAAAPRWWASARSARARTPCVRSSASAISWRRTNRRIRRRC